jgi:hypothetical protein
MPKKKVSHGYLCEACGKMRTGAHTDKGGMSTAGCPSCLADGVSQKYTFVAHVNSYGHVECFSGLCPKHGEIKRMFTGYQEPTFRRNYSRWLTGTAAEPPRQRKEI